jgi:hypothetical protein
MSDVDINPRTGAGAEAVLAQADKHTEPGPSITRSSPESSGALQPSGQPPDAEQDMDAQPSSQDVGLTLEDGQDAEEWADGELESKRVKASITSHSPLSQYVCICRCHSPLTNRDVPLNCTRSLSGV